MWSPLGGWVSSSEALVRMAKAARAMGVKFISGNSGHVQRLKYDIHGNCTGVVSVDGTVRQADIVVVATGANTATLVNIGQEVEAQCSVICVIKVEPDEMARYRDMPIISNLEQGIILPSTEDGLIKVISCRAITNYCNDILPGTSVLHSMGDSPFDGCPMEIEHGIGSFLRDTVPELAQRPFVATKLCWDGVAKDLNFRICPFPGSQNLYVATIGSNHGFKFLPIIGKYVADMLEGSLAREWSDLWAWKSGKEPESMLNAPPFVLRDVSDLTGRQGPRNPAELELPWDLSRPWSTSMATD